jgi:hypothetical protein
MVFTPSEGAIRVISLVLLIAHMEPFDDRLNGATR